MKTVQMTLDEKLLKEVDIIVKKKHTNRSAFTRQALLRSIREEKIKDLEQKHVKGYLKHPEIQDELTLADNDKIWDNLYDTW